MVQTSSARSVERAWLPWAVAAVAFVLVAAVRHYGLLEPLELAAYDAGVRLRPARPSPHVVLVVEREEDLQRYGFPLSDSRFADLVEALTRSGAALVGFDKYRDLPVPPGSERLNATIARHANTVWAFKFATAGETGMKPPPGVTREEQLGFNDFVIDRDGAVRRALLFLDDGKTSAQGLALTLALRYLAPRGIAPAPDAANPEAMRLGRTVLTPFGRTDGGYAAADAAGFQVPLNYRAGMRGFATYSLDDALQGRIPAEALKDKIVLFGSVAESLRDYFATPLQRVGAGGGQATYGVVIHAHIASQLVREALGEEAPLRWAPDWAEYALILLASLLGSRVGHGVRQPWLLAGAVGGGTAAIVGASLLALGFGWWLALVPAAVAYLLAASIGIVRQAFADFKERRTVMGLFARYVSKEVADEIWAQRGEFMSDGKPKPRLLTASVLFSDVAGFTSISEKLPPQDLFAWLDRYMATMTTAIITQGGVINKYIGDAIMALFGVPVQRHGPDADAHNAAAAVASALAMGEALEALNRDSAERGHPAIRMRIGICTGPLAAGTVGIGDRLEFTVIGDTVNVASRLESLKTVEFDGPCRILICAETFRLVSNKYLARAVGEVTLKGRDQQTTVYQVVRARDNQNDELREEAGG